MPLARNISEQFAGKLIKSFIWSRKQQRPFLEKGMEILRQLVGKHYGERGCKERVPQNFVRLMTTILSRYLASRSPQCLVESKDSRLRMLAGKMELWANQRFRESNLEKVLQRWVIDAITYPVGAIKICYDTYGEGDYSEPYIDNIDRERFCWDMKATRWTEVAWVAHRYCAVKEDLVGEGFDEARVQALQPSYDSLHSDGGTEKTENLSITSQTIDSLYDYIECWEFYLPRENVLVTFPVTGQDVSTRPIRIQEFKGQSGRDNPLGPFQIVSFDEVPGNLMATPVVHAIYDLHLSINMVTRKLLRQGENQKTNTLVQQTMVDDGERLKKSRDGEIIPVSSVEAFKALRSNGPDQQNMSFIMMLKNAANWFGGNFDILAGLGANAPTLGQEEMLNTNSSKQLQFMQQETRSSVKRLMTAMVWYEWHSQRSLPYQRPIPGLNMSIPWEITPGQRQGNFDQMDLQVHPFSMRPVSPEQRLAQMSSIMSEVIQGLPILQQQGYIPDFAAYIRKKAEYMDFPGLDEILRMIPTAPGQQQEAGQQGGEAPRVRPPGTGQYTRTSVSSQANQDQQVLESMSQPQEAA